MLKIITGLTAIVSSSSFGMTITKGLYDSTALVNPINSTGGAPPEAPDLNNPCEIIAFCEDRVEKRVPGSYEFSC